MNVSKALVDEGQDAVAASHVSGKATGCLGRGGRIPGAADRE